MKKWLIGLSLVGCLACTSVTAFAADEARGHSPAPTRTSLYPVTADVQNADSQGAHRWEVKSSVQVSRETLREAYKASHAAYTQRLSKYAKCTEKQAKKAITDEHPGMKIEEFQLRNIRTSLVYMAITRDNEDKYLVIVDAGNGKILLDKPLPTHHERVFANHGSDESIQ